MHFINIYVYIYTYLNNHKNKFIINSKKYKITILKKMKADMLLLTVPSLSCNCMRRVQQEICPYFERKSSYVQLYITFALSKCLLLI